MATIIRNGNAEIAGAIDEAQDIENSERNRAQEVDRRRRELNLMIVGITHYNRNSEHAFKAVEELFEKMQVFPIAPFHIKVMAPASILVQFCDGSRSLALRSRNLIMENKSKLKGSRIRIFPDFTLKQRKALPLEKKKVLLAREQGLWSELREGMATVPIPMGERHSTRRDDGNELRDQSLEERMVDIIRNSFDKNPLIPTLEYPEVSSFQGSLLKISDDITSTHIVPKLSWMDIHTLFLVSRSWKQAIETHEVYQARVRSHSTETLAIVSGNYTRKLFLYSLSDNAFCELPPIPQLESRIPSLSKIISLNGKLYVLERLFQWDLYLSSREEKRISDLNVYVLDLAGRRKWQQCSSMKEDGPYFDDSIGCGVVDGKIYVIQDSSGEPRPLLVYDPENNSWSQRMPVLRGLRDGFEVATGGGGLFVMESQYCWLDTLERRPFWRCFYDPDKDEWRSVVGPIPPHEYRSEFVFQGDHYCVTRPEQEHVLDIHVFDLDTNSWKHQHSVSWDDFGGIQSYGSCHHCLILPVKNELLAIMEWNVRWASGYSILQTRGFGSQRKDIEWHVGSGSFLAKYGFSYPGSKLCLIDL